MHLYETTERKLRAWNSVDALLDKHGPLQHGSVINVRDSGLIIDFYCAGQRSMLVKFGKVFASWIDQKCLWLDSRFPISWTNSYCPPSAESDKPDVQVLLRVHPDGPWLWHPGKLLMCNFVEVYEYVFVAVQLGGTTVHELVRLSQVRFPPSEDEMRRRIIQAGEFVMRTVDLPDGYWQFIYTPELTAAFCQLIDDMYHARCLLVFSNLIHYLQRTNGFAIPDKRHLLDSLIQAEYFAKHYVKCGRDYLRFWNPAHIKTNEETPLMQEERCFPLPRLLLVEIFQSLDTIGRQRCRRTCHRWEVILTSNEACRDVRVSFGRTDFTSRWLDHDLAPYAVYSCVLKHVTPATCAICFLDHDDGWQPNQDWRTGVLDCLQQVLGGVGRRIQRLVFFRFHIHVHGTSKPLMECFEEMTQNYDALASCCEKIIHKDVVLTSEHAESLNS
ncbi:uncharacterized protein LOC129580733 isoform X2 [Paramacrobiotus metropolitanus]|uniref:uncharacterized protein LOC129580733 isoform X2 n=1 Tax=Paramacrobiotus metropolitanus TaxID=2943436 RepID=UPI002445A119|nr:uncharacterized protein LOC129580733 isoform X2 [Paramacrobiotus metropolitanus]